METQSIEAIIAAVHKNTILERCVCDGLLADIELDGAVEKRTLNALRDAINELQLASLEVLVFA